MLGVGPGVVPTPDLTIGFPGFNSPRVHTWGIKKLTKIISLL